MVPVVILALALVTPAFTFPFTAQTPVTSGVSGTHTGVETVITGLTPEEKTGIEGQSQVYTPTIGVETGSPITQQVEKTGLPGVPQTQVNPQVINSARPEVQGEHSGLTEKTTGYSPVHNDVPVEFQTSPETNVNTENHPTVVKTQEVVNSEQTQGTHTEQPVLLPVQPLSVLPVSVQPLVVPAEAISTGRLIIMAMEPIRQRFLQDATITPEKQATQQQTVQQYVPVQTQVVEPSQQVFNLQPELVTNPVSTVEKQGQYQQELQTPVTSFVPVQTQVPQIRNHPVIGEYNPVPSQTVEHVPQTPIENVERQGSTHNPTQTQGYEQGHQVHNTQQTVKTAVEQQQQHHQVDHTPAQVSVHEPSTLQQQVYNVPVEHVVPNQQVIPQTTQDQVHKTQEVGAQQPYSEVPSRVCNYAAPAPVGSNFGDRIHPNQQSQANYEPSQTLSVAPFGHVTPEIVPHHQEQQHQVVSQ